MKASIAIVLGSFRRASAAGGCQTWILGANSLVPLNAGVYGFGIGQGRIVCMAIKR